MNIIRGRTVRSGYLNSFKNCMRKEVICPYKLLGIHGISTATKSNILSDLNLNSVYLRATIK